MCFEMLDEHLNGSALLPALRAAGWAPGSSVALGMGSLAVATSLWALWGWVGAASTLLPPPTTGAAAMAAAL